MSTAFEIYVSDYINWRLFQHTKTDENYCPHLPKQPDRPDENCLDFRALAFALEKRYRKSLFQMVKALNLTTSTPFFVRFSKCCQ